MTYKHHKTTTHSAGGCLLLEAPAELALVLGSSAMPPPSRNMVTAISRLLLHASNICFPTLSVAPANKHMHSKIWEVKHKHTGKKETENRLEIHVTGTAVTNIFTVRHEITRIWLYSDSIVFLCVENIWCLIKKWHIWTVFNLKYIYVFVLHQLIGFKSEKIWYNILSKDIFYIVLF